MDRASSKTVKSKTSKTTDKKNSNSRLSNSVLAVCPADGAGWCPYPFSATQLKKRLKKLQEQEQALVHAHK